MELWYIGGIGTESLS